MTNSPAWAIAVKPENVNLILSEAGRNHTREQIEAWIEEHGTGYFLRDPNNPALDCQFFQPLVFAVHYNFKSAQNDDISLQEVIRI